jgi:hypothetical protein
MTVAISIEPGEGRFVLIAGVNQETIVGVHRRDEGFVFTTSEEGDGTVPLAQLDGCRTYFAEAEHGSLPNNGAVTRAVIDLLERAETGVLGTGWVPRRSGVTREIPGDLFAPEPFDGRTGSDIRRGELRHLLDGFAAPARVAQAVPLPPVASA